MSRFAITLLAAAAAAPFVYHYWPAGQAPEVVAPARAATTLRPSVKVNPERDAYFGDLHLHTANSFDAYVMMGTRVTPDEAFKFGRGDAISYLGQPLRRSIPLDFLAVTDHSENIGVFRRLDDANSPLSQSEIGRVAKAGGTENFFKLLGLLNGSVTLPSDTPSVSASAWDRLIQAANANYQPGKFTTFIAYEWTSMPDGQNLHRNVIFKGDSAPAPFTSIDSKRPEDLWAYIARSRAQGHDALAIAHNANASNGLMYDWNTIDGKPIDEAYAQLRVANEPLSEVSQSKGSSETHPVLSPNDEFAGFEIFDHLLIGTKHSKEPGSYWRDALGRGLVIGARVGVNPYKDGAVGAGDLHGGLSVQAEADSGGVSAVNIAPAKLTRQQIAQVLHPDPKSELPIQPTEISSGALTGAWAESNTRDAIFAAFRRKETFATSGTRIKVRFFGGWSFAPDLSGRSDWVKGAYAHAVPMGGDLPKAPGAGAPSFAVEAVKDPNSGNLDRVQIVKVWLEGGQQRERVFDVAWAGARTLDAKTGKVPAIGNTVDLKTGHYANNIGAARLAKVWRDPTFKADQPAVYYVRVIEIPTPRWTTLQAIQAGLPLPDKVPATIQERAWSSPIWYAPAQS